MARKKKTASSMTTEENEKFIDKISGLTVEEFRCFSHVVSALQQFNSLEVYGEVEQNEFLAAVQVIQRIFAMRVLHRQYPQFWLCDEENEGAEQ